MINKMDSSGAQSVGGYVAAGNAYQAPTPYSMSLGSSPFGQVAGSALGQLSSTLAKNPKLAEQLGDRLKDLFGNNSQSAAPVVNANWTPVNQSGTSI